MELDLVGADRDVAISHHDISMGFGDAEILVVVGEVRLDVEVRLFAQAATGEIQRRILGEGGGNEEAREREKKQKDRVKIPRIRII